MNIYYDELTPTAQGRARLIHNNGGEAVARRKGRGYQVEMSDTTLPSGNWFHIVFPENTEPKTTEPPPTEPEAATDGGFEMAPLDQIDPNPYQPRQSQDAEALQSLARGLVLKRKQLPDTMGLMQVPIARRLDNGRYQLAFGHRRWAAFEYNHEFSQANLGEMEAAVGSPAMWGDWSQMPLRVVALDDVQMYDYAARENGDREDINAIEKAISIKQAIDELGWPLTRAANAHGLSKSAGSNLTRLLQLPEAVQQLIVAGDLGQRHGRELVRLMQHEPPLVDDCHEIARRAIEFEMSTARIADVVKNFIEAREISEQLKAEVTARAAHRETRYCHTCSTEREFTGPEIDRAKAVDCNGCGYNGSPEMWRAEPLPELPPEPVHFGTSARMYDHWSCGFCNSHEPPGLATWATIDGQDMKVCLRCKGRLQPLVTITEPEPNETPATSVAEAVGSEPAPGAADDDPTPDWNNETWTCNRCGRNEPKDGGDTDGWTLNELHGFTCRQCWETNPPPATVIPAVEPKPSGDFDCPKCGAERIVKTNGSAWCLNCDAKWETPEQFHKEREHKFLAATFGTETERQPMRQGILGRIMKLMQQATLQQLAELDAWLDDADNEIFK